MTPCPPTQHLATFIMDKSEAIASVEDAIRKLVQLSSKEKIWTQEMLLQVNDQSLRLLDIESQVPRWEEGAGWSCPVGAGSHAELWACPWGLKPRAEGREDRAGPESGEPRPSPHPARALRGWPRRAGGVAWPGARGVCVRAPFCAVSVA